jgi:hypothetical protein
MVRQNTEISTTLVIVPVSREILLDEGVLCTLHTSPHPHFDHSEKKIKHQLSFHRRKIEHSLPQPLRISKEQMEQM